MFWLGSYETFSAAKVP